jgi:hypothetical protein
MSTLRLLSGLVGAALLLTLTPAPLAADAEGLTGTVSTADGSPVAGVQVWLIHTYPEGILATTTTDAGGHYRLTAAAGDYYEAVAMTQDVEPTWDFHSVYHEAQRFGLTLAAGGTTLLDWVLPEMSMNGNCTKTSCKVHVSVQGFDAFEPVQIAIQGWVLDSGRASPLQLDLGVLTTNASGAAKDAFSFVRPARGTFHTAAIGENPSHVISNSFVVKWTASHETLLLLDKPDVAP